MLTLKDLSTDKDLDRKAMTAVTGGSVFNTSIQTAGSSASGGLVGISQVHQGQFVFNSDNDINLSEGYALNIASPFGLAIA